MYIEICGVRITANNRLGFNAVTDVGVEVNSVLEIGLAFEAGGLLGGGTGPEETAV